MLKNPEIVFFFSIVLWINLTSTTVFFRFYRRTQRGHLDSDNSFQKFMTVSIFGQGCDLGMRVFFPFQSLNKNCMCACGFD